MKPIDSSSSPRQPSAPREVCLEATYGGYFLEKSCVEPGSFVTRYRHPEWGLGWILLRVPISVDIAHSMQQVDSVVRSAFEPGMTSVLLLTFEAGAAFHPHLKPKTSNSPFLAWAAHYRGPAQFFKELGPPARVPIVSVVKTDLTEAGFSTAFREVKSSLAAGESYQVNLTQRLYCEVDGSGWDLFVSRAGVDPAPYCSFVDGGVWQVASWSPELFLERKGPFVRMRPMKGTAPRERAPNELQNDKTFAENLMIVDMVRNDLGTVAKIGSVVTPKLFEIEAHRSVWQMTSSVEAHTAVSNCELLKSVFPPASVTGAPKLAACGVIDRLEVSPRGLYCGGLGFISESGDARLSVGIRTAFIEGSTLTYGVGSGIVWDSVEKDEHEEWGVKSRVLRESAEQWALLETLDPRDAGGDRFDYHLSRLAESCRALGIRPPTMSRLKIPLDSLNSEVGRLRVTYSRDGEFSFATLAARPPGGQVTFRLGAWPVSSSDPSLKLKTTSRAIYRELQDLAGECDEVLLYNGRGELTEFSNGGLLMKFGDRWFTPPIECGCLPSIGVSRSEAEKRILRVESLADADEIVMVNARGRWRAVWKP